MLRLGKLVSSLFVAGSTCYPLVVIMNDFSRTPVQISARLLLWSSGGLPVETVLAFFGIGASHYLVGLSAHLLHRLNFIYLARYVLLAITIGEWELPLFGMACACVPYGLGFLTCNRCHLSSIVDMIHHNPIE